MFPPCLRHLYQPAGGSPKQGTFAPAADSCSPLGCDTCNNLQVAAPDQGSQCSRLPHHRTRPSRPRPVRQTHSLSQYNFQTVVTPTMVAVLDSLAVDKFSVVGHDFGAGLAWGVAFMCPTRVERLVVLSVGYMGECWLCIGQEGRGVLQSSTVHGCLFSRHGHGFRA